MHVFNSIRIGNHLYVLERKNSFCNTESINIFSDVYKLNKLVTNFQQLLDNLFLPLFEVTANPESHPNLHVFLSQASADLFFPIVYPSVII